jgi:hypothetical protein
LLVVGEGPLIEKGAKTALEILTLLDLEVQDEKGLESDGSVLATLNVELSSHHPSEYFPDKTLLREACFSVIEVLL